MAIPTILCSKHYGTGSPQVYQLSGGTTLTQIGSDFDTGNFESQPTGWMGFNRVLEFKGKLYVWHRSDIREENTGGSGVWGAVHTITDISSNDSFSKHTGLHRINVGGTDFLVGLYLSTGSQVQAIFSSDGSSWTETGGLSGTINLTSRTSFVFNNQLYWNTNVADTIYRYDKASNTLAELESTLTEANADFCGFNDKVYALGSVDNIDSPVELAELRGNVFTSIHTFTSQTNGSSGEQGHCCLFTDNVALYAVTTGENGTSTDGDAVFKIENPGTGSQTVTDITTSVLPAGLQPGGAQASELSVWSSFIDTDTSATSPDIYLIRTPILQRFGSSTYEIFSWTDDSTTMTSLGTGPSNDLLLPNEKWGGGTRIYGASKVYAEIESASAGSGGAVTLNYRVYGSGADVTITLYVNSNNNIPSTQATLTTPVSGGSSSLSGNSIIDVTPDDGVTLYTATWLAGTDGVTTLDNVKLVMDAN